MQAQAEGGGFREDARRLLRVSYERQVAGGGQVTHVDLGIRRKHKTSESLPTVKFDYFRKWSRGDSNP